jgi:hypothetical protein
MDSTTPPSISSPRSKDDDDDAAVNLQSSSRSRLEQMMKDHNQAQQQQQQRQQQQHVAPPISVFTTSASSSAQLLHHHKSGSSSSVYSKSNSSSQHSSVVVDATTGKLNTMSLSHHSVSGKSQSSNGRDERSRASSSTKSLYDVVGTATPAPLVQSKIVHSPKPKSDHQAKRTERAKEPPVPTCPLLLPQHKPSAFVLVPPLTTLSIPSCASDSTLGQSTASETVKVDRVKPNSTASDTVHKTLYGTKRKAAPGSSLLPPGRRVDQGDDDRGLVSRPASHHNPPRCNITTTTTTTTFTPRQDQTPESQPKKDSVSPSLDELMARALSSAPTKHTSVIKSAIKTASSSPPRIIVATRTGPAHVATAQSSPKPHRTGSGGTGGGSRSTTSSRTWNQRRTDVATLPVAAADPVAPAHSPTPPPSVASSPALDKESAASRSPPLDQSRNMSGSSSGTNVPSPPRLLQQPPPHHHPPPPPLRIVTTRRSSRRSLVSSAASSRRSLVSFGSHFTFSNRSLLSRATSRGSTAAELECLMMRSTCSASWCGAAAAVGAATSHAHLEQPITTVVEVTVTVPSATWSSPSSSFPTGTATPQLWLHGNSSSHSTLAGKLTPPGMVRNTTGASVRQATRVASIVRPHNPLVTHMKCSSDDSTCVNDEDDEISTVRSDEWPGEQKVHQGRHRRIQSSDDTQLGTAAAPLTTIRLVRPVAQPPPPSWNPT